MRLQTIWDMVEPLPEARYANFVSLEEPYVDTLSLRQTTLPNVMLAHQMDGSLLTRAHGAPVRLVIPEMYGYKNVKWLHQDRAGAEAARPATGSRTATTSTPGLGAPTATE